MRREHPVEQPQWPKNGTKIRTNRCSAAQLRTGAKLVRRLADRNDDDLPDEESDSGKSRPTERVHVSDHEYMMELDPGTAECPTI